MPKMPQSATEPPLARQQPWYAGVKPYHWLVLAIASAGWIFDIYEGQIFNITRGSMLGEILHTTANSEQVKRYGDILLGVFLFGGAVGGIFFGAVADRWGRGRSMTITILIYAVFSGMTAMAHSLWSVAVLRFLVAVGTGGEWAVAAALVAEVFPRGARAHASGIFHASSILGTWAAAGVGLLLHNHWRWVYLIGIAPAALVLAVRLFIRESESWTQVHQTDEKRSGSLGALWRDPVLRRRALLGLLLAAVGLAGFWAVFVAMQNLTEGFLLHHGVAASIAAEKGKFAYGIVATAGGGLGLLSMGPLCARLGRRPAFVLMHVGALIVTPLTCYLPASYGQLLVMLPVLGFFTLGMHAGYAIYFPELFPTRLRATGAGLCFNGGRLVSALILVFAGWLKALPHMQLPMAISLLSLVYAFGIVLILVMPETAGKPLEI